MEEPELDMEVPSPTGSLLDEEASVSMESVPIQQEEEEEEEDEDLYYIPERRPSLDLGPNPMETGALFFVERPQSPATSYTSIKSDDASSSVSENDASNTKFSLERSDSFSTSYSVDSDDCEIKTVSAHKKEKVVEEDALPELIEDTSEPIHPSMTISFVFKAICKILQILNPLQLETFRTFLWHRYPQSFNSSLQNMDIVNIVGRMLECYSLRVCLQITKTLLKALECKRMIKTLEDIERRNKVIYELRERYKKKYGAIQTSTGEEVPLDKILTDVQIRQGRDLCPYIDHEVISIPKPKRKTGEEISLKDMVQFGNNGQISLVKGIAGSGKSVLIRKLILDWCNQTACHDVIFLYVIPVKEVKETLGDSEISLLDLLHKLFPETMLLKEQDYNNHEIKCLFIFEDFEYIIAECRTVDYKCITKWDKPAKFSVLIVNMLKNLLLRFQYRMFVSRPLYSFPTYGESYPLYEVVGFNEKEREEYFKKKMKDQSQADRVIAYVKSSKTLHIMCRLPLFCSILSDFCQSIFNKQGLQAELPKGITYLYTKLFLALLQDYRKGPNTAPDQIEFITLHGSRGLRMLEKGTYFKRVNRRKEEERAAEELEALTYTGLINIIFVNDFIIKEERSMSFIHPTMQEYMAALYAFITFINENKNVFETTKSKVTWMLKNKSMELHTCALEKSLSCEKGYFDMFMRFLFGFANTKTLELLQPFLKNPVKFDPNKAMSLIKKKIGETQHPDRAANLQFCLQEVM